MNRFVTFVSLDLYSYWYHRSCHMFNAPWHKAHHKEETIDPITEPILSGVMIFGGIKAYEKMKPLNWLPVCRRVCMLYWFLVSSSHYLGHRLDYSHVFPINKIQQKHLFHHKNPEYNYSILLPYDVLFGTSDMYIKKDVRKLDSQ
jgi:sterol desaturase/sphingolipid hydroxylase (fatty acid hydroxylase superfamily)